MASINSLPPEVTEIIIRKTAASGDGNDDPHFKNQLTLTARISFSWTYPSQMIMHSDLEFHANKQANEWLESGIAGKFKTKSLELGGYMDQETIEKVMNNVIGVERISLDVIYVAFDVELLHGERFSELKSFESNSELSYEGNNLEPFQFQLSKLSLEKECFYPLDLLIEILATSSSTLKYLNIHCDELIYIFEDILKFENFPRIKILDLDSRFITTLAPLRELETFHTTTGNDEAELDHLNHLEFILSTILPGQLKRLGITIKSGGQIEEEDLESVERMMKLPGLNRLQEIRIDYEGQELDGMTRSQAEWERRGIEVNFWTEDALNSDDIDDSGRFDDYDNYDYGTDYDYSSDYSY